MARTALIDSGDVVLNVIEADDSFEPPTGVTKKDVGSRAVSPGDVYDSGADTFTTPPPPLDEARKTKVAEIEAKYDAILNGGFDYDFGSKTATLEDGTTETAGVRTLQTRPADRERWATTNQVASQYIGAGQPSEPMRPFRTADNARVPMTAQEANDCLNAMQAKFGAALEAMWDHKDAVRALTDVDAVIAYDISSNPAWP